MKTYKGLIGVFAVCCSCVGAMADVIQVTANTSVTTSNYATYKQADIEIASGVYLTFEPATGETFDITGAISGGGGIKMSGAGDLALYGNNSFAADCQVSSGNLHVYHNNALGQAGTTANRTTVSGTGMVYFHGVTTPEWFGVNRNDRPLVSAANTKNYLSGYLSTSNTGGFISAESGSEFHVTGWFAHNSWGYLRGNGKIFLEGHVAILSFVAISADSTDVTISVPIERLNASSAFTVSLGGGWGKFLRFGCADVMKDGCLELANNSNAYVYLNGHDQECCELKAYGAAAYINSTAPAQIRSGKLTNGTVAGTLPWIFQSHAGFTWTGDDKITLTQASTSDATLGVEGGILELEAGATWLKATNVVVTGGAALKVNSVAFGEQAYLNISEGGTLEIPAGIQLTVTKLFIDGQEQADGVWGKSGAEWTDAHFTGDGTVKVLTGTKAPTRSIVWDAGGADTQLATKENWVGDPENLNFERGNLLATFAQEGTRASVGANAALRGLILDAPGDFTIDGTATLSVLANGIETRKPTSGVRAYCIAAPLSVAENQSWNLAEDTTLTLSNTVSGVGSVTAGLAPNARLRLNGATIAVPFESSRSNAVLRIMTNTVNAFNAKANLWNGLFLEKGSALTLTGGCDIFASNGVFTPQTDGDGTRVTIAEKPLRCYSWLYHSSENWGGGVRHGFEIALNVTGCHFAHGLYVMNNNVLSCGADYALNYTGLIGLTGGVVSGMTGTLRLNGHDQGVTRLEATDPATQPTRGTGIVTSDTPAFLRVRSDDETTHYAVFEGFAGLAKEGTNGQGVMTLGGASTSHGSIEVSNGTLAFAENGSWLNCSNVTVKGTGILKLARNGIFGRQLTIVLADSGKVDLASDVSLKVRAAYRQAGGALTPLEPGTYGATGSGADHIDDQLFSGKGRLSVSGAGLVLFIR